MRKITGVLTFWLFLLVGFYVGSTGNSYYLGLFFLAVLVMAGLDIYLDLRQARKLKWLKASDYLTSKNWTYEASTERWIDPEPPHGHFTQETALIIQALREREV